MHTNSLPYLAASRAAVRLIRYLSGVTAGGSLPLLLLCFTNCALHSETDDKRGQTQGRDTLPLAPSPGRRHEPKCAVLIASTATR